MPAVALLIVLPIGGPSPDPQAERVGAGSAVRLRVAPAPQRSSAASHAGVQSLRSARTIAGRQLRKAGRELRNCARRTPASMLSWRSCVRWPLAHLVIDGRVSGGVLYAIAERGGIGHCREQALGEASGLRLLGGLSDQLVHGLPNSSSQAVAEAARLLEATRSLIVDLRRQLRRPVRACLKRG